MWNYIWKSKSFYAKGWVVGALVVQGGLFAVAAWNPDIGGFPGSKWEIRDVLVASAMALLLLAALFMHRYDRKRHGWGFQDVYHFRAGGSHEENDQKFVPAVLTAESIRAAMTAGILAILLDDRAEYLPAPFDGEDPAWFSIKRLLIDPESVFFVSIVGALASSLVTTMAALLCYEYATRFTWSSGPWPRANLLKKGFRFGMWGFYLLMWSLAVVPVLLDYHLAFISILVVFLMMWLYYFFPVNSGMFKSIFQVTYPNGKIYIGMNLDGNVNDFGDADGALLATQLSPEQRQALTITRTVLWKSATASEAEARRKHAEFIQKLQANDPAHGYNR